MKRPISSKKYDQHYFEEFNRGYKKFKDGSKFHPVFYKALELAKPIKGGNILDIGCGRGEIVYLGALNGYRSIGIDYSDSAVKLSRNLLKSLSNKYQKNAMVKKMDAKKLRFKDNTFDIIFMLDIVEHLYKWELEKVIEEAWRVLKTNGRLIIHTTPNKLLMGPVRFLTNLVGIRLRSEEFHVNEQNIFSLRAYLRKDFNIQRIWIEKDKKYWTNGTIGRGRGVKFMAKMVDWGMDNFLSNFIIRKTFFNFFLGTDVWVVAKPKKEIKFSNALFIANGIVGEMPGLTGGEVRFIEIAKNWAQKGFKIHLLSSLGGKRLCQKLGLRVILHNISQSKSTSRITFIGRLFKSLIIPKSLQRFNQGIIYCSSEQIYDVLPGLVLKLKNPRKIKLAVVVHWLPPAKWWRRKRSTFWNSLFFLISERLGLFLGCFFADKLLSVSNSTREQIKTSLIGRFFINKAHAVNCGVNLRKIREITQRIKEKKYEAVFIKRIQAVKGIFDLIEIWDRVVKNLPKAKLIVIGSGIDEEKAKEMVVSQGLEKNIEFLGVIYDDKEKFTKIAESKLFLLPSYEENWAIVIGEAMAAGVPVIAYRLKELVSAWKDNCFWVPLGNKKNFAKQVIEHVKNDQLRKDLNRMGLNYITQFDWTNIARKELEILTRGK